MKNHQLFLTTLPFLLFVNLFSQALYAQENYQPGYIITLNSDTVHGMVDYRNWKKNPEKISFKESLNGNISEHSPTDIKAFGVAGEIYESAVIETEVPLSNSNELQSGSDLTLETDTVFLQTIIQGRKSLYCYLDNTAKEEFYIKEGTSFELLIYKKYLREQGENKIIAENKRYIGQLSGYLKDCPSIRLKLSNTGYSQRSLEKLFINYYDNTKEGINYRIKTEKITTEFGVVGGVSSTSFNFSTNSYGTQDNFDVLVTSDYAKSTNFTGGLFYEIILPRNQKKWSLYNEVLYSHYKTESHDSLELNIKYWITGSSFEYSYLKMNNMVRFRYPLGKLSAFINVGISNGINIGGSNKMIKEALNYGSDKSELNLLDDIKKYEQGFIFGMGAKINRLSLEMRYELGSGISPYSLLHSDIDRCSLLFGYRF